MNNNNDVVQLVRQFLRIDTSNPPGNEEKAVLFLEAILKKEGINSTIYSPSPGRANIMARIAGKKKGKPVILLSHIDVVPAKEDEWDTDPFGGELDQWFCIRPRRHRYENTGPVPAPGIYSVWQGWCDTGKRYDLSGNL